MPNRRFLEPQHWRNLFIEAVLIAAVALAAAACSGAAPTAGSVAATPTVLSAAAASTSMPTTAPIFRPTSGGPVATATAQPTAIPTARAVPAAPTGLAVLGSTLAAPRPAEGTSDRPFGPRTKESGCLVHDGLADGACTPGAVFPDATVDQVCQPGYSASVRSVPAALSREVYGEYGIVERTTGEYEVDHLVPLETGGSNDIANLFPEAAEPRPGFHEKDLVENYLHEQVCAGAMSLLEGQRAIATNWLDVYQQLRPRAVVIVALTLAPAPQPALTSQSEPTPAPQLEPTLAPAPAPAPAAQPAPATGVQITSVAGARPGGRATLAARTTPGASCSIAYRTPAGTSSAAQGLTAKTADANGVVAWFWEIGPSTRPGTGSVVVTCNGVSARSPLQIG